MTVVENLSFIFKMMVNLNIMLVWELVFNVIKSRIATGKRAAKVSTVHFIFERYIFPSIIYSPPPHKLNRSCKTIKQLIITPL